MPHHFDFGSKLGGIIDQKSSKKIKAQRKIASFYDDLNNEDMKHLDPSCGQSTSLANTQIVKPRDILSQQVMMPQNEDDDNFQEFLNAELEEFKNLEQLRENGNPINHFFKTGTRYSLQGKLQHARYSSAVNRKLSNIKAPELNQENLESKQFSVTSENFRKSLRKQNIN